MMKVCFAAVLLLCSASITAAPFESRPIDFIENQGQWNAPVRFVASTRSTVASFAPHSMQLHAGGEELTLGFENYRRDLQVVGEAKRSGYYNFFVGNDPSRWCSRVPAFGSILYRSLYEGIDVRVRPGDAQFEYDVLLAPGARLDDVVIRAHEAHRLEVGADGSLTIHTAAGTARQTAPRTWQVLPDGTQQPVTARFRVIDAQRYGFAAPERDAELAMVIDPGLEWSTFIGGNDREEMSGGVAMATDGTGDVIVAGKTWSGDFPATSGGKGASPLVPFVARFNSSGSHLIYATLFGSTNGWVAHLHDLVLDASSAPILVGETNGADFPTTPGSYDPTFNEPSAQINRGWDAFITRFDATGTRMVFSTFLGAAPIFDPNRAGSMRGGEEAATAVAVDSTDAVIVTGWTRSEDFPTTAGAYDRTLDPIQVNVDLNGVPGVVESRVDAFVARFNPTGSQLLYSTYLGGQADDVFHDIALDAADVITLTGVQAPVETPDGRGGRMQHGRPFPTTADAWARTHLGASDAILARMKLDGAGTADLKYATILGGTYVDEAGGVAIHPNNPEQITISGWSRSWDFPTTAGAWKRSPTFMVDGTPYYFGFLARFRFPSAGGGALHWSTLIEGPGAQTAEDVILDSSGDVIVTGVDDAGVPTTERSWRRFPKGAYVARFSGDGRQLLYSTVLHPASSLFHNFLSLAPAAPRTVLVAGSTLHPDFPTTPGAFDRVFNTDGTSDNFHRYDGFVAKLTLEPEETGDTTADAPVLISPANGATFPAAAGESIIDFDWSDVADPSGVRVYEVALASNPDFAFGYGFRAPGYVPASQWQTWFSGNGIYYWRVRTLDGANNFSPWSETRRFSIGDVSLTNFCAVTLTPEGVPGGSTVQGKLYILNAAPPGGITYTLTSSNPAVATVPAGVTVPAGANTVTFTVSTHSVTKSTPVQITVWAEGNGDHPVLWVDPAPVGVLTLSSLTLTPTSVSGGASAQGTVTLNGPAPDDGASVTLASSNTALATVPSSVFIAGGATAASFAVTTNTTASTTSVSITGSYGGATRAATLTLTPPPVPAAPSLLSPANDARPAQPVLLDWTDVNGAASYTIQIDDESGFSAPQVVTTSVVSSQTSIGNLPARRLWWRVRAVSSAGNAGNWSSARRFTPQASSTTTPPAAPTLSSLTVNPGSVAGGSGSQGTATLTSAAPSGGAVVSLASSNAAVATVPASVTVPAGSLTATFAIATSSVTASTAVTITATYGAGRTATLTVTPPSTAPPAAPTLQTPSADARFSPGQAINFDWSDVAGAASYTIQIDDDDRFTSPQIRTETVTASAYSTSTLPTRTMWWRVRATSSDGTSGNWSAARRFEVKD